MKVNTDGALLGAWMEILPSDTRMLDIGTGSGVIALMAAQRMAVKFKAAKYSAEQCTAVRHTEAGAPGIVGLEIDPGSYEDACLNFKNAPWEGLRAVSLSLQQYAAEFSGKKFDLIFCNPPYFIRSLKCPDGSRTAARHADTLGQGELIRDALKLIRPGGRLALILPAAEGEQFLKKVRFIEENVKETEPAQMFFRLVRLCRVYTSPRKPVKRYLMELRAETKKPAVTAGFIANAIDNTEPVEFVESVKSEDAVRRVKKGNFSSGILSAENTSGGRENYRREELVIQNEGKYTPEFSALMKEFYLYL